MSDDPEAERRQAVVAKWREEMKLRNYGVENMDGNRLHEMDARECRGDLKAKVLAASEAHISELVERFKSTPVTLSRETLKAMGRDVVASHGELPA